MLHKDFLQVLDLEGRMSVIEDKAKRMAAAEEAKRSSSFAAKKKRGCPKNVLKEHQIKKMKQKLEAIDE